MKILLSGFFCFLLVSCAVMTKKHVVVPPQVTGEVKLTPIGSVGNRDAVTSLRGITVGLDGELYVCDPNNSSVIRLTREGEVSAQFKGFGNRTERFFRPIDITATAGVEVLVVDEADSRILRFDVNLKDAFVVYKKESDGKGLFGSLRGIAFNRVTGDVFVTDDDIGAVVKIDLLGQTTRTLGEFGSGKERFIDPMGLDVAPGGRIFVADKGYGAIGILDDFSAKIRYIGVGVLHAPVDVAVLPEGRLAVADSHGILILSDKGIPEAVSGFGVDRTMTPRSVAFSNGILFVSDSISASVLMYKIEK